VTTAGPLSAAGGAHARYGGLVALGEEIGRLYGLPLEEFVRQRNEAAREARRSGRRDEAEAIARLPKPTIVAWTVNQLARDKRKEVDLLLDSGKRLLDAQRSSLEGHGRKELDRARESLEKAAARLVGAAKILLEERAGEATLERIGETLRSAALSAEGRERLATGTFTEAMSGTNWDVLESLAAGLPPRRKAERAPAAKKSSSRSASKGSGSTSASSGELRATREAVREAQGRQREAARSAREAEQERARARRALDDAEESLEKARRALARADDEVARARAKLPGRR
jgi:hypothetical protein